MSTATDETLTGVNSEGTIPRMARPRTTKQKRTDAASAGSAQSGARRTLVVAFRRLSVDEPLAEREWLGLSQNEVARRDLERYYAMLEFAGKACPAKMTETTWAAVEAALDGVDFKVTTMIPRLSALLAGEPRVPRPLIEWAHGNPFACAWIVDMLERRQIRRIHTVKTEK